MTEGGKVPAPRRSDRLAARIRELITARGLKPGDRFPQAWLAEQEMRASKGTLREAMKALETQGLIRTRSGPGGGTFVTALSGPQAIGLLRNLFLFAPPTLAEVFHLRRQLEPEIALELAGALDAKALADLQATVLPDDPLPRTVAEAHRRLVAGLEFHSLLAGRAANRVLGFVCLFLHALLRDLPSPASRARLPTDSTASAFAYQRALYEALAQGDGESARALVAKHLEAALRCLQEGAPER